MHRKAHLLATMAVLTSSLLWAQNEVPTRVTTQNRAGDLPFSASIGSAVEHVDLASGALDVTIPLIAIPGRGMDSTLSLHFNSNYFLLAPRTDGFGNPFMLWTIARDSGWQTNHPDLTFASIRIKCADLPNLNTGYASWTTGYIYYDPTGGKHAIPIQTGGGYCAGPASTSNPDTTGAGIMGSTSNAFTLSDGTVVGATVSSALVYDGAATFEDGNGNTRTQSTDTLGRSFYTKQETKDANGNVVQTIFSVTDSSGNSRSYTINWQLITINTTFANGTGGNGYEKEIASGTWNVIRNIVLPNGQSYGFKYEDGTYGEITEIDLPTGAVITYSYANEENDQYTRRYVTSRTETVDGVSQTWGFSVGPDFEGAETGVSTVTFPAAGNPAVSHQSVYASDHGAVTDAKIYPGNASGSPLQEYSIRYDSDGDPSVDGCTTSDNPPPPEPMAMRPIRIITVLQNGQATKKEFDYETFNYTYYPDHCDDPRFSGQAQTFRASRGNVTAIREYGWGTPVLSSGQVIDANAPLMRTTTNTYLHNSNSSYLTANIVNKILTQTISDSSGAQVAQTQYEYDTTAIQSTNNTAPAHDANYSSGYTVRGNASRVKHWRNTDNSLLTTAYTYDDLGNIRSITDPGGHTSSWFYDDNWSGSSCLPASNSQAYVSKFVNALGHQTLFAHYACTGELQSRRDQNDINAGRLGTTYSYDLMNRPLCTNYPDGGQTCLNYNADAVPLTITKTQVASPDPNIVTSTVLDGLGRAKQSRIDSDSEGVDYTDTVYDALGRVASVSNPYRSTSDATYGITQTFYDALGRTTQITRQDGSTIQTDYSAYPTVTITDETGRLRRTQSDALGRLVEVDEPTAVYHAAQPATGGAQAQAVIAINGTALQSWQVQTQAAVTAYITIGITGAEQSMNPGDCPTPPGPPCLWDGGTVYVSVDGTSISANYGKGP